MSELQDITEEFKKWKGTLNNCRYPAHLWDKVHHLTANYPPQSSAKKVIMNRYGLDPK